MSLRDPRRPRAVPSVFLGAVVAAALSCGGSDPFVPSGPAAAAGSPAPAAPPSPLPSPSPAPAAAPDPEPSPSPACIHDNDHRVETVTLALYFVECNGRRIQLNEYNDVPLGCRIHLNATPRNGMHQPTCSQEWPVWQVDPPEFVKARDEETFTPVYVAQDLGRLSIRCLVDGVRSNWVFFNLIPG